MDRSTATQDAALPTITKVVGSEPSGLRPVLVFRTSVNTKGQVLMLASALDQMLGIARWTFDLEDRDRVLRIEHGSTVRDEVIALLQRAGFLCAELD